MAGLNRLLQQNRSKADLIDPRIDAALPSRADVRHATRHVLFVQKRNYAPQQIPSLFDHFVGKPEERLLDF